MSEDSKKRGGGLTNACLVYLWTCSSLFTMQGKVSVQTTVNGEVGTCETGSNWHTEDTEVSWTPLAQKQ